jgi:hypothetical protein
MSRKWAYNLCYYSLYTSQGKEGLMPLMKFSKVFSSKNSYETAYGSNYLLEGAFDQRCYVESCWCFGSHKPLREASGCSFRPSK